MFPSTQPMIGRVERQHRLIEELRLRTAPLLSAELLADRLGVTTRTIERDIAELDEARGTGPHPARSRPAPATAWAEARDATQALLDDPQRALLEYDGYFGRTTLQQTIDGFLSFDLLIHGWDIARATGQDETLPLHEVRRVHQDALRYEDALRLDGVCGPPVAVPDDAPEQDRLLGLLGRTP